MAQKSRYGSSVGVRRKSGTKRARRRKNLVLSLVSLLLSAGLGFACYGALHRAVPDGVTEAAAPSPTEEVTKMSVSSELASANRLYTEGYTADLSEDDIWMEDFEDTRTPVDVKGIYLTSEVVKKNLDEILELLDTTELNAIVIDIKNDDGFICVENDSEYLAEIDNQYILIDNVESLIETFHEHGVYCIARIVCFRDIRSVRARNDFGVKMPDGSLMVDNSGYTWMNPLNTDTWEYLTEVGRVAVELGFDEVNFDYCRFSTDSKVKEADYGAELTTEVKQDAIAGFVKYACENLKPLGVYVSVDVFGVVLSSAVDAAAVGQDYARMCKYLDYICPMVYPSHYGSGYYNLDVPDAHPYDLIYNAMLDSKDSLQENVLKGRCAEVRPWLQAFTASWVKGHIDYTGADVKAQIDATYDAGYNHGWLLWNASGSYANYRDGLLDQSQEGYLGTDRADASEDTSDASEDTSETGEETGGEQAGE